MDIAYFRINSSKFRNLTDLVVCPLTLSTHAEIYNNPDFFFFFLMKSFSPPLFLFHSFSICPVKLKSSLFGTANINLLCNTEVMTFPSILVQYNDLASTFLRPYLLPHSIQGGLFKYLELVV